MPTASSYQATYLTQPGGLLKGQERYAVAGALYALVEQLRAGAAPAAAQQHISRHKRHTDALAAGVAAPGGSPAVLSDFQAIDTP